ncbi:DnaJ-like protein [Kribbella antiqua]|uniref:DnaJ-like protein n=1 Tax=Kribbella antiqua TaxID=2512217 RepID=A0A4R2IEA7_9ACTN|nr:J domain-containing protein [Kribbella antiqua]TCO42512.1 DnaJ-like protein [Kribbella antiqua]
MTDPYAILGVTVAASDDDLDHAFRGLVRQLHPDTRTPADSDADADADADQRLQQILTAYATLRDPIRRAAYDRTRTRPATSSPPPRVHAARRTSTTPRVEPAIRVGPVRWQPPTQTTNGSTRGPRRPTGSNHGIH